MARLRVAEWLDPPYAAGHCDGDSAATELRQDRLTGSAHVVEAAGRDDDEFRPLFPHRVSHEVGYEGAAALPSTSRPPASATISGIECVAQRGPPVAIFVADQP
jgi:hypothetical protein